MKQRYKFNIKQMTADCEANYARICRLLPALVSLAERGRLEASAGSGQYAFEPLQRELLIELPVGEPARLALTVDEQSRFTTLLTVEMSYMASHENTDSIVSNSQYLGGVMNVRMYHDLQLAEVISVSGQRISLASYALPNASMFQPEEKAQQNRFLAELLGMSIQKGLSINADAPLNPAEMFSSVTGRLCATSN